MQPRQQEGQQTQQLNQKGACPIETRPTEASQASLPTCTQVAGSLPQGSHKRKKLHLDVDQPELVQQRTIRQLQWQEHRGMKFQGQNSQSKCTTHNKGPQHQQLNQHSQTEVKMQQGQLQDSRQFNHVQKWDMELIHIQCTHRLLYYMYHRRQRPPDNSIVFWRKFVTKYYDVNARKRWCYANCALGVSPDEAAGAWKCNTCNLGPGKGIEAIFETLPRLLKIKFDSGVIDECLFVDIPRASILPRGMIVLHYDKAVQQSSYKQFHVIREGKLRIIFTEKMKIFSWEFCSYHYEELLPRSLLTQLVNHSDKVSEICETPDAENESDAKPIDRSQDTVSQSVDNLVSSTVNGLGFPNSYYRGCQISEVVHTMKDLINFSKQHKVGPIASLQNNPQLLNATKLWKQKMEERKSMPCFQGQYTKQSSVNNGTELHVNGIARNGDADVINMTSTGSMQANSSQAALVGCRVGYRNETNPDCSQENTWDSMANQSKNSEVTSEENSSWFAGIWSQDIP